VNYYNEFNEGAAEWLCQLIDNGLLPLGDVDSRSISEVTASDLNGYTQCHFFAGIGGWSLALKLAEWPSNRPVWTGSCPCQPFSAAGRQKGISDERHLWPIWNRLIAQCKPTIIFGEQVATAISKHWLDLVSTDLENSGYAVGAAVFTAACAGAPHIRDRLYWVGNSEYGRPIPPEPPRRRIVGHSGTAAESAVAHASSTRLEGATRPRVRGQSPRPPGDGDVAGIRFKNWKTRCWAPCTDGKARPFERGAFPVAHGVSQSLDKGAEANRKALHGFGNAIVPQQAALFIRSA
jgi:DNA (cytosine-5)-methyltransferase 1